MVTFVAKSYLFYELCWCRAILQSNCYHKEGHDAPCEYGDSLFILLFGFIQLVFSQIPDFHNMEVLSIMAAVMSFAYTFIGLGLGFAKVIGTLVLNLVVIYDTYGATNIYYTYTYMYMYYIFLKSVCIIHQL